MIILFKDTKRLDQIFR